jgi:uncharacterized membrane protein
LVAGFLFAFAVVVMPGINKLNNKEFIKTFQVIDRIIQNGQPIFMIVWIGSIIVIIIAGIISVTQLNGISLILMIVSVLFYLLGVQLPTALINVPLNNKLQTVNVENISEEEHKKERENFEPLWNRWNLIRTVFACLTSLLLIIMIFINTNLTV